MKVAIAYICVTNGRETANYGARFAATYHQFPAGIDHDVFMVCNGGPLSKERGLLFSSMSPSFFPRQNDAGWDITGFMDAAKGPCKDYDLMLCLGESVYFHRAGWLKRFVEAWESVGPGFYGALSSFAIRAHLQTSAFVCAPWMFGHYPEPIKSKADRYAFEHGPKAFWRRIENKRLPVRLVTWDGVWKPREWRKPQNILWRGDQSNCLMWNNHVDRWFKANRQTRERWSRNADQPFR